MACSCPLAQAQVCRRAICAVPIGGLAIVYIECAPPHPDAGVARIKPKVIAKGYSTRYRLHRSHDLRRPIVERYVVLQDAVDGISQTKSVLGVIVSHIVEPEIVFCG